MFIIIMTNRKIGSSYFFDVELLNCKNAILQLRYATQKRSHIVVRLGKMRISSFLYCGPTSTYDRQTAPRSVRLAHSRRWSFEKKSRVTVKQHAVGKISGFARKGAVHWNWYGTTIHSCNNPQKWSEGIVFFNNKMKTTFYIVNMILTFTFGLITTPRTFCFTPPNGGSMQNKSFVTAERHLIWKGCFVSSHWTI